MHYLLVGNKDTEKTNGMLDSPIDVGDQIILRTRNDYCRNHNSLITVIADMFISYYA